MAEASHQLKNYVNGKWADPENAGMLDIENPSTGAILTRMPLSTAGEMNKAVEAAAAAFPAWSATPVYRRCVPLFKLAQIFRDREDTVARVLVAEMGKSLPDARAEIKRLTENCEVACGMPMLSQGDKVIGSSFDIDGEVLRLPIGVCGIIPPFNFPAMVPFWFLPYALAAGNTCVIKPSELVPMTMNFIAGWMEECGFPPGVFNLVNGDKVAAQALVDHPKVRAISFVGRSETATSIATRCAQLNKRCQALGSAKNHLVVMPDAKMDQVIRNMTTSCYGCAGQRCMASSAIIGVGDAVYEELCRRFVEDSRKVIIGDPLDPKYADEPMLMGPVISRQSRDRILQLIDAGIKEGAKLALDGRRITVRGREKGHYVGPTVFVDVKPGMTIHATEVFGPVVAILKAATLDEAIGIINSHRYGNGASIYTQNGHWARRFKLEVDCGMIGINIGIPAPVAYLPFGGAKDSMHGDSKGQGVAATRFFTEERVITERFLEEK